MEISIGKIKSVIDDLQVAELTYRRHVDAYETVCRNYKKLDREGNDVKAMRIVLGELEEEYNAIRKYRKSLTDIVRCYESAERNIINWSSDTYGNSLGIRRIDIESVKDILSQYNIKIV